MFLRYQPYQGAITQDASRVPHNSGAAVVIQEPSHPIGHRLHVCPREVLRLLIEQDLGRMCLLECTSADDAFAVVNAALNLKLQPLRHVPGARTELSSGGTNVVVSPWGQDVDAILRHHMPQG